MPEATCPGAWGSVVVKVLRYWWAWCSVVVKVLRYWWAWCSVVVKVLRYWWAWGSVVVKALRYKSEGPRINSRCRRGFFCGI
jgi:hypothetical protein